MVRYLLDTNILIMVLQHGARLTSAQRALLSNPETELLVSAVSVWEMAIKWRKGKLALKVAPNETLPVLRALGINILPLDMDHAIADPQIDRALKDPFDRMIAAVAEVEQIRFVTTDSKLRDHPLAWRP